MKTLIFIFTILVLPLQTPAAPTGQWRTENLQSLNYQLYVPRGTRPKALMVNLHGCTQKAKDLVELGNWENAADKFAMVVAIPDVPMGGVMMGCWDYYGKNHSSQSRHHAILISLVETLLKERRLNIDSKRVYISGLSSGSAEAMLLGCLRPDLFTGIAMNSGPAIGTDKGDLFLPNTSPAQVSELCRRLAGPKVEDLERQMASVIVGEQDFIVKPDHSNITTTALQEIYEASDSVEIDMSQVPGTNNQGKGILFKDEDGHARISFITNHGLGHAWPSGKGEGRVERYINPQSIDYPAYLARFFEDNNKRLKPKPGRGDRL